MSALLSLVAVVVLMIAGYALHAGGMAYLLGVVVPYTAIVVFIFGVIYRVAKWAKSPVPFRIPTTCGQQKSLEWIKANNLEAPHNLLGLIGRMALEILFFRSLFRNTRANLAQGTGPKLVYGPTKWLWLAGLAFHWSFLVIFIRHVKFFAEPVPFFVLMAQDLDGFLQIGLPILYITDVVIVAAVSYLLLRRLFIAQVKYISLASDYFPLLLILGIALTGIWMRYFGKTDVVAVKELALGLVTLRPTIPATVAPLFFIHFLLVCTLFAYFPFSKLMHMGGIFLSPTRNLLNNNRTRRHINPWNPKVKVHTYEEYEDEFRDKMKASGLPLDFDPEGPKE